MVDSHGDKQVWLITGAGRGLGVYLARAALAAGHAVVATGPFCSAYAAGKFGVEGWAEALAPEIAPFGLRTLLVEPGFFRTELLSPESTSYAEPSIADYADRTRETIAAWSSMDGKQGGDPARLAGALIALAARPETPLRFAAGADAVAIFEAKADELRVSARANLDLSVGLDHEVS